MSNDDIDTKPGIFSRRAFLGAAGAAATLPLWAGRARAADGAVGTPARPLKLAWNPNAACLSGVAVAYHNGIFDQHGLSVELINFSGSTDQLLEAIATGKADAGVGMALRWLKPLEQGFDVKISSGLHGGCLRLLVAKSANIKTLADLKGKTIAVGDMAGPGKNFFSVALAKIGLDPTRDVEWRQYPANLLGLAIEKGEAQALTDNDPLTWGYLKDPKLEELATNLTGEYHDRTCCLVGLRGSLVREDAAAAKRLDQALWQAWRVIGASPDAAAAAYAQYAPKFTQGDIADMLRSHHHQQQVAGDALRQQLALYVDELKIAQIFRPSTDSQKFARRITVDIVG